MMTALVKMWIAIGMALVGIMLPSVVNLGYVGAVFVFALSGVFHHER